MLAYRAGACGAVGAKLQIERNYVSDLFFPEGLAFFYANAQCAEGTHISTRHASAD